MTAVSIITHGMITPPASGGGGGGYFTPLEALMAKTQFVSNEDLVLVFPPFLDRTSGSLYDTGVDNVTLTIKRPNGTLLPSPPTPTWDSDVKMWTALVSFSFFMEGSWLILAESDGANAAPQNQVLTWGDYVDDIPETRQAALGRWRVDVPTNRLILYEEDGTTIFKEFDLKDQNGAPTSTTPFERDPV
jgi:hypothetical protein